MDETKAEILAVTLNLMMKPSDIAYRGSLGTDADKRSNVSKVTEQHSHEIAITGYDFAKCQQVMPITAHGERRPKEDHLESQELSEDFFVQRVSADTPDTVVAVEVNNARFNVQALESANR